MLEILLIVFKLEKCLCVQYQFQFIFQKSRNTLELQHWQGPQLTTLPFLLDSKPSCIKVILAHLLGTGKWGDRRDAGLWAPVTCALAPALPQFFFKFCNFPALSFFNDKIREMNKIISIAFSTSFCSYITNDHKVSDLK